MLDTHRTVQTYKGFVVKEDEQSFSKPNRSKNNVLRDTTNRRRNLSKKTNQSEAVKERKAELEQLRQRSLTKDIATRLRNEKNLKNFAERQRKIKDLEKIKSRQVKAFTNDYRTDGNELNTFTKNRRRSLQLEKPNLRETKLFTDKNYRADGHGLEVFAERRRKSLQLERTKLREAKIYLNNYRAGGNELDKFTERRRKSLEQETVKVKDPKYHANNYRAEGKNLLASSCRERNNTGSKSSHIHSCSPMRTKTSSPKGIFTADSNLESHYVEQTGEGKQFLVANSERKEISNGRRGRSDQKETKVLCLNDTDFSRDESPSKEIDSNDQRDMPASSESILQEKLAVYRPREDNNDDELPFGNEEHVTLVDDGVKINAFNSSSDTGQKEIQTKIVQNDNVCENNYKIIDCNQNLTEIMASPQSSNHVDKKTGNTPESNENKGSAERTLIPYNDDSMKAIHDPYYDDEDSTLSYDPTNTNLFFEISKREEDKDCFTCSIM